LSDKRLIDKQVCR